MWRNVGKDFGKPSWLEHYFWVLCILLLPPQAAHVAWSLWHMHSESINSAAAKDRTCKPIFCSDLWVFLPCTKCHFEFLWIPGEMWPVGIPSSIPFNLAKWCWAVFYKWSVAYVLIFPIICSPLPMFPTPVFKKFYFWLWLTYPKGAQ